MAFKILHQDASSPARLGLLATPSGDVQTPVFMPVGTNATVKAVFSEHLTEIDTEIILANTYHLYLRPGMEVIKQAGGLHAFMRWPKPILTDSGGFQVFSLAKFRKIREDGVQFQSHIDGAHHFFTPEDIISIQRVLGSDVMMPLDECVGYPCSYDEAQEALRRTSRWARRAKDFFFKDGEPQNRQLLFGIAQGSSFPDLRRQSAEELVDIAFDGYAIGGVSVGEPVAVMFQALDWTIPYLPAASARYVMGIGTPDQIVSAIGYGVDMFDCCIPTRYGRYGTAFTRQGKIVVRNGAFAFSQEPLDKTCPCFVCRKYTRSYLRHLFNTHEILGLMLVSYHNVYFYLNIVREVREAIRNNQYLAYRDAFLKEYQVTLEEPFNTRE